MKKAAKSKEQKKVVSEEDKVKSIHKQSKEVVESKDQKKPEENKGSSLFERALGKGNNYTIMTESASSISDELKRVRTGKYNDKCIHRIK